MQPNLEEQTPLMRQYWELKSQVSDSLLFFRMGDFYELFGEDAVEAARILEITLTSRDKNKANPIPMAGVPHHSVQGYIQRLLRAGKKVSIGEQMEDPSKVTGKNIVKREITRTFTPGVQFDFEGSEANYLAALAPAGLNWSLACVDASTGETLAGEPMTGEALLSELARLPVRHLLRFPMPKGSEAFAASLSSACASQGILEEEIPTNTLRAEQAEDLLKRQYGVAHLGAFLYDASATLALAIAVQYVMRTQKQERAAHLRVPAPLQKPLALTLGPRTAQHLDLIASQEGDASPTLFKLINRTKSALGARNLKRWMLAPLSDAAEISARQEAVREIAQAQSHLSPRLASVLAEVYDLERIMARANTRLANPRDTLALGRSLSTLQSLASLLSSCKSTPLKAIHAELTRLDSQLRPLSERILKTQKEEAPLLSRDGGIFNVGTSEELDRLLSLGENGQKWLVELEARERETTGIASLKVRYNRVFGYYIEVTQAHLKNVPAHYQRKQTTVGAERFFTEELKKFEDEIVHASSRQKALEQQLFDELLEAVLAATASVMDAARALGDLDSLFALSQLALEPGWSFPEIDDSLDLEIRAGRHPLVDQPGLGAARGSFVPNDLTLSPSTRLTLMITGPNMGGKSTVMRQTALIVILGQMGAPIPASSARWGAVTSVYTRIGAHDAIARGQSTFMVEMSELAHILHHADERSLIVLDEIGRGTSTYDGISVAWATLEWITTKVRARTLFATHYHELTRLSGTLPALANAHMAVAQNQTGQASSGLRFLYQLREGPTNESFGVHVARIAGLPSAVVERAWNVLKELESGAIRNASETPADSPQLSLFGAAEPAPAPAPAAEPNPVLTELANAKTDEMTPLQALNFVVKLKQDLSESLAR